MGWRIVLPCRVFEQMAQMYSEDSTKDNGGDIVETTLLLSGLLTARAYYDGVGADEVALRSRITALWVSRPKIPSTSRPAPCWFSFSCNFTP